jgi:hypothetical protein
MVSLEHEAPIWLLRLWPTLVVELLGARLAAGGTPLPAFDEVAVESEELTAPVPVERRADLVLALRRAGIAVLTLIVEVQLRPDEDKRRRLPEYVAAVHGRGEGAVLGLLLCLDEPTARWARRPIETFQHNSPFVPVVLGPAEIPRVIDEAAAHRAPAMALLSGLVHARGANGYELARVALSAAQGGLSPFELEQYTDLVLWTANDAVRARLEEEMQTRWEPRNPVLRAFLKRHHDAGVAEGEAHGRAEGEAHGRAEGEAHGRAEGEARGLVAGRAEALLAVLSARGLAPTDAEQSRIRACLDRTTLDRWLVRSVSVQAVGELFDGE